MGTGGGRSESSSPCPFRWAGKNEQTQDVGVTGVCLETNGWFAPDSEVDLFVERERTNAVRFELGPVPQTVEELRRLQAELPPWPGEPRPQRAEARDRLSAPVRIAWRTSSGQWRAVKGCTREVSATSMYFELDPGVHVSSPNLLLELEPGLALSVCAVARVMHVEQRDGKIGIDVVMDDYCVQALPD